MKIQRPFILIALCLALFSTSWSAQTKSFTQADLEKMVSELDAVIPHNEHFKYPIKCMLVDKADVNAYAKVTEEGKDLRATMVVFTGLAKGTKNDPRLIRACVAHELSHLSRGHVIGAAPSARDLSNLWTRQQEFEADKFGAEALVKAGYAKKDMVDLLMFLDSDNDRHGYWLEKLTGDHADPKARAAEISDNPSALNALMLFDTALAYEDAREHLYANKLFAASVKQWPDLTEAYTNSAKCALLFYYDNLPSAVRNSWWRPDFGPLITTPHAAAPQAAEVTDEDRERWNEALTAAQLAVEKNKGSDSAYETLAITKVLEPNGKKATVQSGIDWFKASQALATNDSTKLRYANNAGLGLQRNGDLSGAYHTIMDAQKATNLFNSALGENLGRVTVNNRSKEDDTLAANVLFTWLGNTPQANPYWQTVKETFGKICMAAGIKPKEIAPKPLAICKVTTLYTSNKHFGILLPVSGVQALLGVPEKELRFSKDWPDLSELRWNGGLLSMFTERGKVMRITSSEPGAYLVLKPVDPTSSDTYQIKVGMTKAELFGILNEKASEMKNLAHGGEVESWNYFPGLGMGVLIENDKVKSITVSPVASE